MNSSKNAGVIKLKKSRRNVRFRIAEEILRKPNKKAFEVLSNVGWSETKDPKSYVSKDAIARFYGVEHSYLNHVMWNNGLTIGTPGIIRDPERGTTRLYSANVVLSLAPLMCAGRSVPKNAKARSVFQVLTTTDYASKAMRAESPEITASPISVAKNRNVPTDVFKDIFERFGEELAGAMAMALSSESIHTPAKKRVNKRTSAI